MLYSDCRGACGYPTPIILSDRSFNYEICDKNNSILIEPDDIQAMEGAIVLKKNDEEKLLKMGSASLEKAKDLSLEIKVKKLIEFMELK